MYTAIRIGHDTKRYNPIKKRIRNAPETLDVSRGVCVYVVSTSVASINRTSGLVVVCKRVGATHSLAKGYGLWGYPQPLLCGR